MFDICMHVGTAYTYTVLKALKIVEWANIYMYSRPHVQHLYACWDCICVHGLEGTWNMFHTLCSAQPSQHPVQWPPALLQRYYSLQLTVYVYVVHPSHSHHHCVCVHGPFQSFPPSLCMCTQHWTLTWPWLNLTEFNPSFPYHARNLCLANFTSNTHLTISSLYAEMNELERTQFLINTMSGISLVPAVQFQLPVVASGAALHQWRYGTLMEVWYLFMTQQAGTSHPTQPQGMTIISLSLLMHRTVML